MEEIDGVAEGAGADPLAVFAARSRSSRSTSPSPRGAAPTWSPAPRPRPTATCGSPTPTTSAPESEDELVAIEWRVPGDPVVFTIGIGPWISVGFNSAGLALTGNELSPNDDRIGIPRLLLVRDIVRRRTLADAVAAALHRRRASSYNNLLSHRDGGVVSVEGSATDAELLEPGADGTLAHTNHYTSARMSRYERDPAQTAGSETRYRSACGWLARGPVTPELAARRRSPTTRARRTRCAATSSTAQPRRLSFGASPTSQKGRSVTVAGTPATRRSSATPLPEPRHTGTHS